MILWVEIITCFSSPCIGTPGSFGQGGVIGGSSGSISSSSSSINLIPKVLFYSQTPLYGHPLNMDSLLCLWEKKALTFSLNSTRIIRTPHYTDTFFGPFLSVLTVFDCTCPPKCKGQVVSLTHTRAHSRGWLRENQRILGSIKCM